jgi:hypothetical protein
MSYQAFSHRGKKPALAPDVWLKPSHASPLPLQRRGLRRAKALFCQWGRLQPPAVRHALGFAEGDMPVATTLHDVFKRLDVASFEATLTAWGAHTLDDRTQQLVLDGKALRGIHGEQLPGVRLVAMYALEAGLVLAQAGGQDPRGAGAD